jgi:hypothetical protein
MKREINQKTETGPKWQAITSLVLGIISVLAEVSIITFPSPIFIIWLYGGWLFAAVGFILGIMGLKYTRKKLAIAGVVLSVIGFVAFVYLYYIALRMGQA